MLFALVSNFANDECVADQLMCLDANDTEFAEMEEDDGGDDVDEGEDGHKNESEDSGEIEELMVI